jgi:protein-L-isoaspartate(D-aspartate) O-methyltransferase
MAELNEARRWMVAHQILGRGVHSERVAWAMQQVPREAFIDEELREFAYADSPLPIGEGQTISQPYIVAYMLDALDLEGDEKVLEVGTGSGYAAAVLSLLAPEVYTIERNPELARRARDTLERLGYRNVHVIVGDGTLGWPEAAPYDAIVVAAGGKVVPPALREQLAEGGRLVIPVGPTPREQRLIRIVRTGPDRFEEEELLPVRFVPLIGEMGWDQDVDPTRARARPSPAGARTEPRAEARPPVPLPERIAMSAERFDSIESVQLDPLLDRIGNAIMVLMGEATHGTSEFYRMRAAISQALIERKGFNVVAVEADWPDAARIDHYVRDRQTPPSEWKAFTRFPEWMWRNAEVQDFVEWLRGYNLERPKAERVGFHGLDLYSLHTSINAVLRYLDEVDPESARLARERYGCLTPWESDPATYGRMALTGRYRACESAVVATLTDMLRKRAEYFRLDPERYADAVHNARLVANAERYYRSMYYGSAESWNLRDQHMFETLSELLRAREEVQGQARAIVWAHNSHIGDARYTEMSSRGELNIGQLCRQTFGAAAFAIGFGTDRGTVAAADDWDGPMQIKHVRPAHPESYEGRCHESKVEAFFLPLGQDEDLRRQLMAPRLERAIGVIYRPQTEMASHYFQAVLPGQFDEYCWFDQTSAVRPLRTKRLDEGVPETYPFGL